MSEDIDRLLAQPPEEPADGGFSVRTMLRAQAIALRQENFETIAWILAAVLASVLLPLTGAGQAIAETGAALADSLPFALGCGVLILTWLALRILPDWIDEA